MLNTGLFEILFDPTFLATMAAAIFAFATIITLGLPLAERDQLGQRLKAVSGRPKLARAGYRGQGPVVTFMFFRFVMPFVVLLLALVYLFGISNVAWGSFMKINASVGAALLGFYLPDLFLNNTIARRQQSIMRAFPDALDLLLICVESGMSI